MDWTLDSYFVQSEDENNQFEAFNKIIAAAQKKLIGLMMFGIS